MDFSPDTTPSAPKVRWLGRYALIEKLAEGGMGSVHLALRDGARGLCVLKQIRSELGTNDIAVRRFYREASIGAQLIHPRIAQVLGAGTEDGVFCIAMELVRGLDLETMHRAMLDSDRVLPPALVVNVALGVLEGLGYAHTALDSSGAPIGVVHRDITLRNIMVGFDGKVKIIDFGLVRGGGDDLKTRAGAFLGTPRFASPEQALGADIDRRSDIYSLSVGLFELLTGTSLVRPGHIVEMLDAIVKKPAPSIYTLNPAVPRALADVVARGLAKRPEERWPDAATYAQALREAGGAELRADAGQVSAFMRERFPGHAQVLQKLLERGERLVQDRSVSSDDGLGKTSTKLAPLLGDESGPELTIAERTRVFAEEDALTSFKEFRPTETGDNMVMFAPRRSTGSSPALSPLLMRAPSGSIGQPLLAQPSRDRSMLSMVAVAVIAAGGASALTAYLVAAPARPPEVVVVARPVETPAPTPEPREIRAVPAQVVARADPTPAPASSAAPPNPSPRPRTARTSPTPIAPVEPAASPTPSPSTPAPSPTPPPIESIASVSPLQSMLDLYIAAPTDENRDALVHALERHPGKDTIARQLAVLGQVTDPQAAINQFKTAIAKLER